MDAPLSPQHVTFLLDDQPFDVIEFSESGFSLEGLAAECWTIQSLGWGREAAAGVRIEIDGTSCAYDVKFRVAGLQAECVEVAIMEMPSELRFRLRHARQARERLAEKERQASKLGPHPSSAGGMGVSKRLILDGSVTVLEQTILRRVDLTSGGAVSPTSPEAYPEAAAVPSIGPRVLLTPQVVGLILIGVSMLVAIGIVLGAPAY